LRLNLSKSGVGGSLGRTGLRIGIDAAGKKYFSVGLPGTGLSYRTTFGRPVTSTTLKRVGYLALALFLAIVVFWVVRSN
jgi:hypothetical protein